MIRISATIRKRCFALPSIGVYMWLPLMQSLKATGIAIRTDREAVVGLISRQTWIDNLWLYGWNLKDISALGAMTYLRGLYLSTPMAVLKSVGSSESLETLGVEFKDTDCVYSGADALRSLFIGDFDASDCKRLDVLSLRSCALTSSTLRSLDGLRLYALRELGLKGCKRLHDLRPIVQATNLCHLDLTGCKGVRDLSALSSVSCLQELYVIDCGRIDSLLPLSGLGDLTTLHFYGDTRIEDGKVGFLRTMPKLRTVTFANRTHYDSRREDFL